MTRSRVPRAGPDADDARVLLDVFDHVAARWALTPAECQALLGVDRHGGADGAPAGSSAPPAPPAPQAPMRPEQRAALIDVLAIDLLIIAVVGVADAPVPPNAVPEPRPLADRYVRLPGTGPDGAGTALDAMLSGPAGRARVRAALEHRAGWSAGALARSVLGHTR